MATFDDEAKYVIQIFRSLCTSRKDPVSVRTLIKDYKELEGQFPPKCGFATIDELLDASGEFLPTYHKGQMCIHAKITQETAHIVQMKASERSNKRRSGFRGIGRGGLSRGRPSSSAYSSFRGATRTQSFVSAFTKQRMTQPPRQPHQNFNNSNRVFRSTVPKLMSTIPPPFNTPEIKVVEQTTVQNVANPPPMSAPMVTEPKYVPPQPQQKASTAPFMNLRSERPIDVIKTVKPVEEQKPQYREIIVTPQQNIEKPSRQPIVYDVDAFDDDPKTETPRRVMQNGNDKTPTVVNNNNNNKINSSIIRSNAKTDMKLENHGSKNDLNNFSNNIRRPHQPFGIIPRNSVQSRLEVVRRQSSTEDKQIPNIVTRTQTPVSRTVILPEYLSHPKWWNDNKMSNNDKLIYFCKIKGCEPPKHKIFRIKDGKQMKFQCQVTVEDATYSSYPGDFNSSEDALTFALNEAVVSIKESLSKTPVVAYSGSNDDLLLLLHNCITRHKAGIFMTQIPTVILSESGITLPDCFENLIIQNDGIYFKLELNELTQENVVFALEQELSVSGSDNEPPPIQLPWHKKQWSVYVTHVSNTNEVWCQLFGESYKDKSDILHNEMEQASYSPAVKVEEGGFYVLIEKNYPLRVQALNVYKDENQAKVFCIDTGLDLFVTLDQIYSCDKNFLKLPAQAVLFSLAGLEMFYYDKSITDCVANQILYQALIADVQLNEEEYTKKCFGHGNPIIDIHLWDTSSAIDVNQNEKILEMIIEKFSTAQINCTALDNIIITGVTSTGEISCHHRDSKYLKMIAEEIAEIVSQNKHTHALGFYDKETDDNLYLVLDPIKSKWYRAKLLRITNASSIKMFLVDIAVTDDFHKSNIYRLADIHIGLNAFPPQGMQFRLHGISINDETVKLIRGLVKLGSVGMVSHKGKSTADNLPEVRLLILYKDENRMAAINDIIVEQLKMEPIDSTAEQSNDSEEEDKDDAAMLAYYMELEKEYPSLPRIKIPDAGNYMEIKVLESQTPKLFYFHVTRYAGQFNKMMADLQKHGRDRTTEKLPWAEIIVNVEYLAFRKEDKKWCRVKVLKKFDEHHISVKFIDYFIVDVVSSSNMKHLTPQSRKIAQMAIAGKVHGIKPNGTGYSTEAALRFKDITKGKNFHCMIKNIEETVDECHAPAIVVELEMFEIPSMQDISHILIKENLAISEKADEKKN